MSEKAAKFTKGPWRVAADSYGGFNRIWEHGGCDVACCEGDGSIPLDERRANECLVASAPELYEALEAASEYLGGETLNGDTS